jgi:hypothetical protein
MTIICAISLTTQQKSTKVNKTTAVPAITLQCSTQQLNYVLHATRRLDTAVANTIFRITDSYQYLPPEHSIYMKAVLNRIHLAIRLGGDGFWTLRRFERLPMLHHSCNVHLPCTSSVSHPVLLWVVLLVFLDLILLLHPCVWKGYYVWIVTVKMFCQSGLKTTAVLRLL